MAKKNIMITVDTELLDQINDEMRRSWIPSRSSFFRLAAIKLLRQTKNLGYMDMSELPFPDVE